MGTNLAYDVMTTVLLSLSPERRAAVKAIVEQLVFLRLENHAMDAILAAVILEAAEVQYVQDGGSSSPKESALDALRPIFAPPRKQKKKSGVSEN